MLRLLLRALPTKTTRSNTEASRLSVVRLVDDTPQIPAPAEAKQVPKVDFKKQPS